MVKITPEDDYCYSLEGVEVFRAGDYGTQGKYTAQDLADIAGRYDPALCEAPLTMDHVEAGPAFGWVKSLRVEGEALIADFSQVPGWFLDAVKRGTWKKRSVEFVSSIPELKGMYLRAVTFLGAITPRVQGMPNLFSAAKFESQKFDSPLLPGAFQEAPIVTNPTPPNPTPPAAPENFKAQLDGFSAENAALTTKVTQFAAENAALTTKLAEVTASNAALATRFNALEAERAMDRAKATFSAAFSAAAQEGRVTKAEEADALETYLSLPSTGEVKFGVDKTGTPRDRFLFSLTQRPQVVPVGNRPVSQHQPEVGRVDRTDRESFSAAVDKKAREIMTERKQASDDGEAYAAAMIEAEKLVATAV